MTIASATAVPLASGSAAVGAAGAALIASSPAPAAGALYPGTAIIATTEDTGPDSTGNYVDGRTVTYQVATGDIGSVWLPYAQLTAAAVAAAINAQAEQLAAIWQLSNPG